MSSKWGECCLRDNRRNGQSRMDTLDAYASILKYYAIEKDPELTKKLAELEKQDKN
jgi:hypothetical protein